MLDPIAKSATALSGYHVQVTFDNGEVRVFDATPLIKGSWFGKLADEEYFKKVRANGVTIVWPDGQDVCPEELYDTSRPI